MIAALVGAAALYAMAQDPAYFHGNGVFGLWAVTALLGLIGAISPLVGGYRFLSDVQSYLAIGEYQ